MNNLNATHLRKNVRLKNEINKRHTFVRPFLSYLKLFIKLNKKIDSNNCARRFFHLNIKTCTSSNCGIVDRRKQSEGNWTSVEFVFEFFIRMKAFKHIYCVKVPKSKVLSDTVDDDEIWWPCLMYSNYPELLSDIPKLYVTQRAKLFLNSLKCPKTCPVGSLLGAQGKNDITAIPFIDESSIGEMKEKSAICDFIDWYYGEYDTLSESKKHEQLKSAVESATNAMETSLKVYGDDFPSVTRLTVASTISSKSIIDKKVYTNSNEVHSQTYASHKSRQGQSTKSPKIAKAKDTSRRVSIETKEQWKRKSESNLKRKRQSSFISEASSVSSPGRVWGSEEISQKRVSRGRPRKSKQRKSDIPLRNNYVTPHNKRTLPRDPGKPIFSSGCKSERSSESEETLFEHMAWKDIWKELSKRGWIVKTASNVLHDWYYYKPGYNSNNPVEGVDYYISSSDVINYVVTQERNERKRNSYISKDLERESDGMNGSPAFTTSSTSIIYEITEKDLKPTKIFFILKRLHFRYSNGKYIWPGVQMRRGKNINKPTEGRDFFESFERLEKAILERGVPGLEANILSKKEEYIIRTWLKEKQEKYENI